MARFAVINPSNIVVNVIEARAGFAVPGHTVVASDVAGPGDTWDGTVFTKAGPPARTRLDNLRDSFAAVTMDLTELLEMLRLERRV